MTQKGKTLEQLSEENPFAMSIGDLMAALLLIFILLLSAAILNIQKGVESYRDVQRELHDTLMATFKDSLPRWNASIDSTLTVRFFESDTSRTPKVLFDQGKAEVKDRFKEILDGFIPKYIGVLNQDKFKSHVQEIRIEGHTSSEWSMSVVDTIRAYYLNMQLSQDRTRQVLIYCLGQIKETSLRNWTQAHLTANGLSSSKLIYKDNIENKNASRRVEFRVLTDAEKQIDKILSTFKGK